MICPRCPNQAKTYTRNGQAYCFCDTCGEQLLSAGLKTKRQQTLAASVKKPRGESFAHPPKKTGGPPQGDLRRSSARVSESRPKRGRKK